MVFLISGVGVAMLYSAAQGSMHPWANAHMEKFAVGLILMIIVALVDIRLWLKTAYVLYAGALGLLILVELMGARGGGAERWIDLGFIRLQPSELMQLGLVLAMARYFNGLEMEDISKPQKLLPPILFIAVPTFLVLKQPDLGTSIKLMIVGMTVAFCAGVKYWKFITGILAVVMAAPFLWLGLKDYQKARIYTFINPESDPSGSGYHIIQSKIAFGSGGFFGKGYLQGTQTQLEFLPEAHTDFIFALLSEEWGMLGGIVLLSLFAILIATGLSISIRSENQFGRLLALGLAANLFFYVFINVGMVMGLLPVVGVPLPMVSYGGTAMMVVMISMGYVMNVHIHQDLHLTRFGDDTGD